MKSISRGMTFKRDLIAPDEMEQAVAALAGAVAEQLRRGLQNLVDQYNSGTRLHIKIRGRVAELVYAADLKSASFTGLWVRVPFRPPINYVCLRAFFVYI